MKTLVLVGSGEFTPAMLPVDRHIFGSHSHHLVAILPTAAGFEPTWPKWISRGVHHFQRLGVPTVGVPVITKADAFKPDHFHALDSATAIYLSGGHPGYLLDTLKDTPVLSLVLDKYHRGAILIGCSAGAMLMGSWILANGSDYFFTQNATPHWSPSLGLIPYSIIPHFDYTQKKFSSKFTAMMRLAPQVSVSNWLGIDEKTALVINNKSATILGRGTVTRHSNNRSTTYNPGQTITL